MSESYESGDPLQILPLDLLRTPEGLTVTADLQVPEAEHELLWNMVQEGFIDLNRKSYEKQDMTREELEADLDSPHVVKYIARDADDVPIGLLTVHVGLEDITWTDTQPLKDAQSKIDPNAMPYYVGTLVVPPDMRGTEAASSIIRGSFRHFKIANELTGQRSLVFFDCADANHPWLGKFIQGIGSPSADYPDIRSKVEELYSDAWVNTSEGAIKIRETSQIDQSGILDKQHYYSIDIDPAS